jgi:SHS2 domain-containing protein
MGKYSYFEHDADIGIVGQGKSIEEAFESAAKALFSIQCNLSEIRPLHKTDIDFSEEDNEYALVTWLNSLVFEAQSKKMAFSEFSLKRNGEKWHGEAAGEHWTGSMTRGVEVKGATLTGLSVKQEGAEWAARCIVDV